MWLLTALWLWRTNEAIRRLGEVPDISRPEWDLIPPDDAAPSLTVVVPARNEAENIGATLETLVVQQYSGLRVLAIDDRSTDRTRQIVDEFAERYPERIGAIHIDYLPEGWLGKTFALEVGTRNSASEYLLFTDADVLFSPSSLRRAMAFAATTQADHVVVMPTPQVKGRGEGMMLGFLSVLGVWITRPWRVSDPQARHDVLGVGAFNLVRREALEVLGGWEPQRLAVIEDVTLGRRMKAAGLRQRVAFGPDLVLVHWAKGARGIVRGLTKNFFAAVNFRPLLMLACVRRNAGVVSRAAGRSRMVADDSAGADSALLHRSVLSHHERAQPHRCALRMVVSRRRVRDGVGDRAVDAVRGGSARRDVARYVLSVARAANAQQSVAVGAERRAGSARGREGKKPTVGARLLALWPALRSRQRKKER